MARETDFGKDAMALEDPLSALFPEFCASSAKKAVVIAYYWNSSSETWDLGIRRRLFDREVPRWAEFTERLEAC